MTPHHWKSNTKPSYWKIFRFRRKKRVARWEHSPFLAQKSLLIKISYKLLHKSLQTKQSSRKRFSAALILQMERYKMIQTKTKSMSFQEIVEAYRLLSLEKVEHSNAKDHLELAKLSKSLPFLFHLNFSTALP